MVNVEYQVACAEVIEILKNLPQNDFKKIPPVLIEALEANRSIDHNFNFDIKLSLNGQKISKVARLMLAVIYRDYLASDSQREKIIKFEKQEERRLDEEKKKKYNPDEIFINENKIEKNINKENIGNDRGNNELIVIKKQGAFEKFLNIIKSFFRKV